MEKYMMIQEVGSGTYGSVWKALSKHSGELVAIKKIKKKYQSWEECLNLREVKVLSKLDHLNIIKLKGVIRENGVLYFVFEYMECDLHQLMRSRGRAASEAEVRNWCFQVFQGLTYLHQSGYLHRDIKPGNLLISNDHVKIADFGMAREFNSLPPFTQCVGTRWSFQDFNSRPSFTQCVGTRWYRAPETMLQSPTYGPPVDMWAMGATMAELLTCRPLFRGTSEADQMYKMCRVLGSPTRDAWPEGLDLATAINYQFPKATGVCLSSLIPGASKEAINLIASLCSWDPHKRPTAMEALQHPFFQSCFDVPASVHFKPVLATTPPVSVVAMGILGQENGRRDPVNLSKPPLMDSCFSAQQYASLISGMKRKLDLAMGILGQENGRRYPVNLSKPPLMDSCFSAKQYASLISGMQRKLDLNDYNVTPNDKNQEIVMKQHSKCCPPGMDGYNGYMGIAPGIVSVNLQPSIDAGRWDILPDLFKQQRQEILAAIRQPDKW